MTELIIYSLAFSLIVQFIYACFWEGMIFGRVAGWLMSINTPNWLQKPLFGCPICMTPYYTALMLVGLHFMNYITFPLPMNIIIIFIASGFSTIFSTFYND